MTMGTLAGLSREDPNRVIRNYFNPTQIRVNLCRTIQEQPQETNCLLFQIGTEGLIDLDLTQMHSVDLAGEGFVEVSIAYYKKTTTDAAWKCLSAEGTDGDKAYDEAVKRLLRNVGDVLAPDTKPRRSKQYLGPSTDEWGEVVQGLIRVN